MGYGIEEWHSLPWWHKEVYLEGLRDEFGVDVWQVPEQTEYSGFDFPEYDFEPAPVTSSQERDSSLESLSDIGFSVRVVE